MPELPEVETIRRGLENRIIGREIVDLRCGDPKIFQAQTLQRMETLNGERILDVGRRGKYLVIRLDSHRLIIHLGMTGQITVNDPSSGDPGGFLRHPVTGLQRARQHPPDRHTHLQLLLDDGRTLMLRDPRKFGKVVLLGHGQPEADLFFSHLGIEPFTEDYRLESFLLRLDRRSKTPIKAVLLDQSFVAGVGNIYADEALFEASVHPRRRVGALGRAGKKRLFEAIPVVLGRGIEFGGTSLRDYIDSDGRSGRNQDELNVYGRYGQPCRRCGTAIRKIVVSQRGTHFCPNCQRR